MPLILPPGVEPTEPPAPIPPLPREIQMSLDLLQDGIRRESVIILSRVLADTNEQVYDLGVVLPHPLTGEPLQFVIGRLFAQRMKDADEPQAPL